MTQSHALSAFDAFFEQFRQTQMWRKMLLTREDSPWHREANVAEHTRMLISWYMNNLVGKRNDTQRVLTLVGCLFHDVGKPVVEIKKWSPERGDYRAYHGHEQVSARMWVDYALTHPEQMTALRLSMNDVSNISFMLEHHVPFGLKDHVKRKALKESIMRRMGEAGHRAWLDMLLCDQHGRISDGQAEKLAAVDAWMKEWEQI